jgi:hypothetical protein
LLPARKEACNTESQASSFHMLLQLVRTCIPGFTVGRLELRLIKIYPMDEVPELQSPMHQRNERSEAK